MSTSRSRFQNKLHYGFTAASLLGAVLTATTPRLANSAPLDGTSGSRTNGASQSNSNGQYKSSLIVPTQFQTIQSAVDAAKPGDSIQILPGTYTEQVSISKNLSVTGSGEENTFIKAPITLTPRSFGRLSIVDINKGASVALSNLTVTGPGSAPCGVGSIFGGIFVVEGAKLYLNTATVTKIHDTPKTFCFPNGSAVRIGSSFPSSEGHAIIHSVKINKYQENGILVLGSGSTAEIFNNTITGFGVAPGLINGGVDVARGGSATISNNNISGNHCTSVVGLDCGRDPINQSQGVGIAISDSSTGTSAVDRNEVSTSDVGIYLYSSAATVTHNRIFDSSFFGILIQNGNYTVSRDRINGGEIGVGVVAETIDTVGTLVAEEIKAASIVSVKEISCCGFKATAVIQKSAK